MKVNKTKSRKVVVSTGTMTVLRIGAVTCEGEDRKAKEGLMMQLTERQEQWLNAFDGGLSETLWEFRKAFNLSDHDAQDAFGQWLEEELWMEEELGCKPK